MHHPLPGCLAQHICMHPNDLTSQLHASCIPSCIMDAPSRQMQSIKNQSPPLSPPATPPPDGAGHRALWGELHLYTVIPPFSLPSTYHTLWCGVSSVGKGPTAGPRHLVVQPTNTPTTCHLQQLCLVYTSMHARLCRSTCGWPCRRRWPGQPPSQPQTGWGGRGRCGPGPQQRHRTPGPAQPGVMHKGAGGGEEGWSNGGVFGGECEVMWRVCLGA